MNNIKEHHKDSQLEAEHDLNDRITKLTNIIQEKYPEFDQFIGEMPITIPNDPSPQVNIGMLQDYYDSLCQILKNYEAKNNPE